MGDVRAFLARVAHALRRQLYGRFLRDRGGDHRAAILVTGTGRSGTSWFANVINHRNEHRYVFEPFHPGHVALCSHFPWRKYLRPGDDEARWLEPTRAILSGQIRGPWVDAHNRRLVSIRRLIKSTRANLFLGWLHAHFPELPLVLLLRHPCAVALSRRAKGWSTRLEGLLSQEALVEDHLAPFVDAMQAAESDFEKSVFLWCVDAYVPLRQLGPDALHVTLYEELHLGPEQELDSLFAFLGLPWDERALREIGRPSLLSRPDSAVIAGRDVVRDWRGKVTPDEAARAEEILALFGLGWIYGPDGIPVPGAAERCFGPLPRGGPAPPGSAGKPRAGPPGRDPSGSAGGDGGGAP